MNAHVYTVIEMGTRSINRELSALCNVAMCAFFRIIWKTRWQSFVVMAIMCIHNNKSSERIMTMLWTKTALLPSGWQSDVLIEIDADGRIADVQTGVPEQGDRLGILLPAPVNVHSHAFQRAMAGLTERRGPNPSDSFWTWRQLMFRVVDRL